VLQVKEDTEESQAPVIVCTNQVPSSKEANSWLYHYYMVQSRLQYGLAYRAHSPTLGALYYPHMGMQPQYRAFQHWEAPSPLYRPQDLSNKSPSWRSDSSGSPLEAPYPAFQPR
jgi:hypothetical protein